MADLAMQHKAFLTRMHACVRVRVCVRLCVCVKAMFLMHIPCQPAALSLACLVAAPSTR